MRDPKRKVKAKTYERFAKHHDSMNGDIKSNGSSFADVFLYVLARRIELTRLPIYIQL